MENSRINVEPMSRNDREDSLDLSEDRPNSKKCRRLIYGDLFLRITASILYALIPFNMRRRGSKMHHSYISLLLLCFQWLAVSMYFYFIKTYWTSKTGPRIPNETMVIIVGLNTSGAASFTLILYYFYSKRNDLTSSNGRSFRLIPKIEFKPFGERNIRVELSEGDWLLSNVLFIVGLISVAGTLSCDFALNAFLDFYDLHNFTAKISGAPLTIYYLAVSNVYWGFCATVCTCCIFHVMSSDIINHIDFTEKLIIKHAKNREDFFRLHDCLIQYTHAMVNTLKYWFAIHNFFFIFLITATIFEWMNALKRAEKQSVRMSEILVSQLTGSFLIAYKFAFPFFSASRITTHFVRFYHNLAQNSKLTDVPNLVLLRDESGFRMCSIRITTNLALLAILSSFIGALKIIADFYST